jgi:uncharacterized membrane protein YphA (DoxX/SURF4 family)
MTESTGNGWRLAPPQLQSWAIIDSELLCGFMIFAGLLIFLASIPGVATLLVAIFAAYLPNGFSSFKLLSVDAAMGISANRVMRPTFSISPVLWPLRWAASDRSPWMD